MEEAGFSLAQLSPEMKLAWPVLQPLFIQGRASWLWSQVASTCWDLCLVSWPLPGSGLAHIQRELQGLDSGPFIETGASGSIKTKINFSPKACQQAEAPSMSWLEPLAAPQEHRSGSFGVKGH